MPINIVWLKRDFRLQDHVPIDTAEQQLDPYMLLYIVEPSILHYEDSDQRHYGFIYQSILEMNTKLKAFGRSVQIAEANRDGWDANWYNCMKEKPLITTLSEDFSNLNLPESLAASNSNTVINFKLPERMQRGKPWKAL